PDLRPFPTRRSSDLNRRERDAGGAGGERASLVLELIDDTASELGTNALGAGDLGCVAGGAGALQFFGAERGKNGQGNLAAHALHRGQQAEPVALGSLGEAEQAHIILADLE